MKFKPYRAIVDRWQRNLCGQLFPHRLAFFIPSMWEMFAVCDFCGKAWPDEMPGYTAKTGYEEGYPVGKRFDCERGEHDMQAVEIPYPRRQPYVHPAIMICAECGETAYEMNHKRLQRKYWDLVDAAREVSRAWRESALPCSNDLAGAMTMLRLQIPIPDDLEAREREGLKEEPARESHIPDVLRHIDAAGRHINNDATVAAVIQLRDAMTCLVKELQERKP